MSTEFPQIDPKPGVAERALDAATDVAHTLGDVASGLNSAIDRVTSAIDDARRPGKPLATVAAMTREAPLASLIIAFMFGIAVARRR